MNPHLFFDLEKGLYDQAKRKVQTARAIKQTEDAISSEAPAEKKPRFTMQHLHAAKEKFKEKHGVAADTSRKSILNDIIAKSGPVGDAVTASKLAHSSSAAAHAGQGGHDVAAKAHRDAANKHWRVMNRVSSDTPKHEKHRQLMKQHYDIAESHDKLVTKGLAIPEWFSKAQR